MASAGVDSLSYVALEAEARESTRLTSWRVALKRAIGLETLPRTLAAASVVGTVLWFVNIFPTVLVDSFTVGAAVKTIVTYLVPWLNATFGAAVALRLKGGRS